MNTEAPKIPNVITDFTNQVDRTFRGLGRITLFKVLTVIANKSVIDIGEPGTGKTKSTEGVPNFPNYIDKTWNSFTFDLLNLFCEKLERIPEAGLVDENLLFRIPEVSSLSEYHRGMLFTVISTIISDKSYTHPTSYYPHLKFENCRLTCLIDVQPLLFSRIAFAKESNWANMSRDRFVKMLTLNPLRNSSVDVSLRTKLPSYKLIREVTLPPELNLTEVHNLFAEQISAGRCDLYTYDYLKAYAGFKNQLEVTQTDVNEFYYLFKPYLKSFNVLQQTKDLTYQVVIPTGNITVLDAIVECGLRDVTKIELVKKLKCSNRSVETSTNDLIQAGIVVKSVNTNTQGQPVSYKLNNDLTEYFEEYSKTIG